MTGGWGFVARDCNGNFLEGGAGNFQHVASALQAEAMAIVKSIERVVDLGMTRIILETDAAIMGRALVSEEYDRSQNGGLFRKIRDLMCCHFTQCTVSVQDYVIL
jgi:ribonuclease HI